MPALGDLLSQSSVPAGMYAKIPVQGNCSHTPSLQNIDSSGAPLLRMKPRQCLILTDARVLSASDSLWLDGVYIRLKRKRKTPDYTPVSFVNAESTMWMTHTTIQGDGSNHTTGSAVLATYGSFYAERATMLTHTLHTVDTSDAVFPLTRCI